MNPPTNWIPGLAVLAVGFVAAALFLLSQRRKGAGAASPRAGELEDLERRYQSRIEQLKELAADKHSLAPERYEAERSRLEQEAVAALRARDEHLKARDEAPAPARPAPAPTGFLSPQFKGALWGGGIVLFFGVLGYTLVSEQHPRAENEAATGRVPPGGMGAADAQQGAPQMDSELQQAWEKLRQNPADLESAAIVSHELIRNQMYEEAERVTLRALALDPFNVELRVHQGVLQAVRGDESGARRELLRLADTYPDAQEGLLFLGALAMKQGDKAGALDAFERFAVEVPGNMHPPPLLAAIQQLRTELGR
jgi:tetratricopeptide (TPR) repeat protein